MYIDEARDSSHKKRTRKFRHSSDIADSKRILNFSNFVNSA